MSAYDLAVIGAGSAGFSAAMTAAKDGAHVALIGHGTIGGTCVNVGCVPSKTMIRATETLHHANAGRFAGIAASGQLADWSGIIAQKDGLVASLRQSKYIDQLRNYDGIDYLPGPATFDSDGLLFDGAPLGRKKSSSPRALRPACPTYRGSPISPI